MAVPDGSIDNQRENIIVLVMSIIALLTGATYKTWAATLSCHVF
jgi:hypothetical protein